MMDELFKAALHTKKKYRVVVDGNGDYRIQYTFAYGAMIGPAEWSFEPERYRSLEEAEKHIGSECVSKVVKEY